MKRTWRILLTLCLLITLLPSQPAQAAVEFRLWGAYVEAPRITRPISQSAVISPDTGLIRFGFTPELQSQLDPAWVTVRDSKGNDPGWRLQIESYGQLSLAPVVRPLPVGETYQITLKGGPTGLRSATGLTLPADIVYTLRVVDGVVIGDAYARTDEEWLRDGAVLQNGGQVDQGLVALDLYFTKGVENYRINDSVSMTNSAGASVPVRSYGHANRIIVDPVDPLEPNETYTVHVKGGPGGVQAAASGEVADSTFTFSTRPGDLRPVGAWFHMGFGIERPLGAHLPGTVQSVRIELNRPLDCHHLAFTGKVTLTDSQGQSVPWEAYCGMDQYQTVSPWRIRLEPPPFAKALFALQPGEHYTIRIKGGPEGIRSKSGLTLAEDLVIPFTAVAEPAPLRYSLGWPYQGAVVAPWESYRLTARSGPLTLRLSPDSAGEAWTRVTVLDAQSGDFILDEWLDATRPEVTVSLPQDGTYYIERASAGGAGLEVVATDLQINTHSISQVAFTYGLRRFETKNEPFSFGAELLNPEGAETLWLLQGAQRLSGVSAGYAASGWGYVDTTKLADGIHWVTAVAEGAGGTGNTGWLDRPFLVDRVDSYWDVGPAHWARPYIEVMSHLGIVGGPGDGSFKPGRPVRRDEFAKMLVETLGLTVSSPAAMPFVDMKEDWAKPYLQAVYEAGYMQGEVLKGRRYFKPDQTITRAEAAVTLARVLGTEGMEATDSQTLPGDWAAVPVWARAPVARLMDLKWINGFPDGTFGPAKSLNRDQAAKVLANFLGMQ